MFPSYDAPGIGPIWPTELYARQIFLVVFLSLAGMVTSFLLCIGLAAP